MARNGIESDFDSDPEMKKLRDEFIESLPPRRVQLARFLAEGNREELRRLVHSLAGVAGAYGFPQLGEIAGDFDDGFESFSPQELDSRVLSLDEALAAAIER